MLLNKEELNKIRIYSAYVTKDRTKGRFDLFHIGTRSKPIVPYEKVIRNYARCSDIHKIILRARLEEKFTFLELMAVQSFLQVEHGIENFHYELFQLPIDRQYYPEHHRLNDLAQNVIFPCRNTKHPPPLKFVIQHCKESYSAPGGRHGRKS
jgi:hypothetical protein